jgi:hypothetical protein
MKDGKGRIRNDPWASLGRANMPSRARPEEAVSAVEVFWLWPILGWVFGILALLLGWAGAVNSKTFGEFGGAATLLALALFTLPPVGALSAKITKLHMSLALRSSAIGLLGLAFIGFVVMVRMDRQAFAEEFRNNKAEVLVQMTDLVNKRDWKAALAFGSKYGSVDDPALDALLSRARLQKEAAEAKARLTKQAAEFRPEKEADEARRQQEDVVVLRGVGDAVVKAGLASHYKLSISEWALDVYVPSLLTEDARLVATSTCAVAMEKKPKFERGWTVRGFLIVGDRPAATCAIP